MRIRIVTYSLISFVMFVLPWIPLPFSKPEVLHALLGVHDTALVRIAIFICFVLASLSFLVYTIINRIRKNELNRRLLFEGFIVLCLPFASASLTSAIAAVFPPFDVIVHANKGRDSSAFINPYLGYSKYDCTSAGNTYDHVFFPSHVGTTDADFVAFAPRRTDKTVGYRFGKKEGDWYLDHKGSQWDEELRTCVDSG